jgi:hypothetical protein
MSAALKLSIRNIKFNICNTQQYMSATSRLNIYNIKKLMFATSKNLDLILTHALLPAARTSGAHLPSSCRGAAAPGRQPTAELP